MLIDPLEALWDEILSRQPERIRAAFTGLPQADRQNLLAHLERMATEKDWLPEQRRSARAALKALRSLRSSL
ncbi:MAG TPA: hypothetical protein VN376_05000 [Longilinea sp.]|nr:hypothetical protein [Longilinea sp.]